jgi:DNA-directed RNA polymerase
MEHNMSDQGIHFNHELDLYWKRKCQAKFEETHSREEFIRLVGRNYL